MFKYAVKRVFRSYKLFLALTLGVLIATSFFASTNVAADILARDSLEASIEGVVYDVVANSVPSNWTSEEFDEIENKLEKIPEITGQTRTSRLYLENYNKTNSNFTVIGLEWNSDMVQNLQLISGRSSLNANETYVLSGSTNESQFQIDDIVEMNVFVSKKVAQNIIVVENGTIVNNITLIVTKVEQVKWNLTVAGFVSLPEDRRYAMEQNPYAGILLTPYGFGIDLSYNILLANWALTFDPLLEQCNQIENRTGVWVWNSIHVKVDRASLIDPYNIENSIERLRDVARKVSALIEPYGATISSSLILPLTFYSLISLTMNIAFIALSLPIFFMAYFTGTMVSDVGYNLRRREIGLLLTKGYKRDTIRNMFLIEGLFIGAISGVASAFLGTLIAYYTLGITRYDYVSVFLNNSTSMLVSIIIGMALALISVWRPANRASKLEVLDALKQYIYVEETSEYKKLLPTITFVLGTYKLIVWILGIDMNTLLSQISPGNFFLALLIVAWLGIDGILNFLGPIAFLYGATKIFMRGSPKFQEAVVAAGKRYFGAFGNLATRNVKRNPARNAAIVFLLSLIVSYGVFTIGSLFAEYDRVERNIRYNVGADIRIELEGDVNVTTILDEISDISDVVDMTPEYRLTLHAGDTSIATRGIRPEKWLSIAFWESEWFLGDFQNMINEIGNDGIILSVDIARDLDLEVGDTFQVRGSGSNIYNELRIVGLIGYQSILESLAIAFGEDRAETLQFSAEGDYPSLVSETFLDDADIIDTSVVNVLIDTEEGVNGTYIQEVLDDEIAEIGESYSYTSSLKNYYERPIESGITKIRWVAIVFAVILALVGTSLVIILGLKDKDAEIALLTIRGFSKWQLFKTLLAEMLVIVLFALVLGSLVGFVEIFGNVNLENQNTTGLIRTRMIVGGMSGVTTLLMIGIVLLAAIIPVWWASRKPESKVDILRA
jgi:ABC-type antimicrobial peptide transport system permease subunit